MVTAMADTSDKKPDHRMVPITLADEEWRVFRVEAAYHDIELKEHLSNVLSKEARRQMNKGKATDIVASIETGDSAGDDSGSAAPWQG